VRNEKNNRNSNGVKFSGCKGPEKGTNHVLRGGSTSLVANECCSAIPVGRQNWTAEFCGEMENRDLK
jgi:hypothetical protein